MKNWHHELIDKLSAASKSKIYSCNPAHAAVCNSSSARSALLLWSISGSFTSCLFASWLAGCARHSARLIYTQFNACVSYVYASLRATDWEKQDWEGNVIAIGGRREKKSARADQSCDQEEEDNDGEMTLI